MGDDEIIARIETQGVDFDRLDAALQSNDNWGALVHSYEYLAVLGAVREVWRRR